MTVPKDECYSGWGTKNRTSRIYSCSNCWEFRDPSSKRISRVRLRGWFDLDLTILSYAYGLQKFANTSVTAPMEVGTKSTSAFSVGKREILGAMEDVAGRVVE